MFGKRESLLNIMLFLPACVWNMVFFVFPAFFSVIIMLYKTPLITLLKKAFAFGIIKTSLVTLLYAVCTSMCSLLFSSIILYGSVKSSKQYQYRIFIFMLIVSQISFVARCFAYRIVIGRGFFLSKVLYTIFGVGIESIVPINTWIATCVISILLTISVTYVSLHQSVSFEKNILLAGEDLGAGNFYNFYHVFLPSIKTALVSAYYVTAAYCFGLYFVSEMVGSLDNYLLGSKISDFVFVVQDFSSVTLFSLALLLIIFLTYYLGELFLNVLLSKQHGRKQ